MTSSSFWLLGEIVAVLCVWHVLTQHVLPSRSQEAFAELVNMPRRHLESLKSWDNRVTAAHWELRAASKAFVAEAARLGNYRQTGPRAGFYYLPDGHELQARLERATNGGAVPGIRRGSVSDREGSS